MVTIKKPVVVGDLVFPTTAAEHWCKAFADANIHWLLLYGSTGTGKSTAAEALMRSRIPDINWPLDAIEFNAAATRDVSSLRSAIEALKMVGNNSQSQRIMIIDEVDCLSTDSMKVLKGLLDQLRDRTPVIMTTNHKDKLEDALLNRFQEVHWSTLSPDKLVEWAKGQCAANGRELSSLELSRIRYNASDYRQVKRFLSNL